MVSEREYIEKYQDIPKEKLIQMMYSKDCELENIKNCLNASNKRNFGVNKGEHVAKGQLSLFDDIEENKEGTENQDQEDKEPSGDEIVPKRKKGKKKSPKNSRLKDVKIEEEHIYPEDTHCPKCGKGMQELKPTIIDYLECIPTQYILHKYIIHNYTCHSCNEEEMNCDVYHGDTSKLPARVIEGSPVTASVIAHISADKFLLGVPFDRQEKNLEKRDVFISSSNMCNWLEKTSELYLEAVFDKMHEDLKTCGVVNLDETSLEVIEDVREGQRSKSYTWLALAGIKESKQMGLYFYNKTRAYDFVNEVLGTEYHGVIQSDGYQAYDEYKPASGHAGCAAHARRKFLQAAETYPIYKTYSKSKSKSERAKIREDYPSFARLLTILEQFTLIYQVERELKDSKADSDEIVNVRNKKELPYWEVIRETVDTIAETYVMNAKLKKAVTYFRNQWEHLLYYINDSRLEPDNNFAEREGIKPYVIARKNFLFAETRDGAKASCVHFSLLISAKLNRLNPESYLRYVLEQLSTYGIRDDVVERCLPYSSELPDHIKLSKNHSNF